MKNVAAAAVKTKYFRNEVQSHINFELCTLFYHFFGLCGIIQTKIKQDIHIHLPCCTAIFMSFIRPSFVFDCV